MLFEFSNISGWKSGGKLKNICCCAKTNFLVPRRIINSLQFLLCRVRIKWRLFGDFSRHHHQAEEKLGMHAWIAEVLDDSSVE